MTGSTSSRFGAWGSASKREETTREQAERLGARLPPLMIQAERVAATIAQGEHGRRRVGQGEAFWQFRRFREEDASGAIDWRQSAKSQHLFVREREWAAAASVWIWRDASPSMQYKSHVATCTKAERATVLALAFASLLIRGGERIGELGRAEPPAPGRPGLNRFAHRLTTQTTSNQSLPALVPLPRFSQIILISDWLTPIEGVLRILRHYGSLGVRGHLIQVLDPAEEDLPFDGRTEFEDVESKLRMLARRAESLRDAYRGRLAGLRTELSQACRRQDWTFAGHRTDRPPQGALLAAYAAISAHRPFEMR
ncbi:MAG: DUF58 domain-containing protein [Alphaproteobacteria bacterium]|nr:DUF58 domain-containing protein [Alphaproteobacteria bacterium]